MNAAPMRHKRVLIIGQALKPLAEQALTGARLEAAEPDQALMLLRADIDLVVIDADTAGAELAQQVIEKLALMPNPPGVLLVGAHMPMALIRALLKLDRSDVLETPVTLAELTKAASAVVAETVAGQAVAHNSRCWTVMGSVGGSGATTLAIELAAILAKRAPQPGSVALFDLHLTDGATCAYLGASANMRLAEASSAPERIDAAILDAFAVRVEAGFDLFASPRDPNAFAKVSPAVVLRVLEMACQSYDFVIVDLPRVRQSWTLDVLSGSDEILIISELTVPALLSARAYAMEIEEEAPEGRRPRLILNRMSTRAFGPAPSRAEAEKAVGRKVDGAVTSDWEAAACSVNLGGPISQHRPRSKIVKDVMALLDRLTVQASLTADRPMRIA
jgi:pilus assembly protein CpaE